MKFTSLPLLPILAAILALANPVLESESEPVTAADSLEAREDTRCTISVAGV
jgi:hypothetical protein